MRTRSTPPINWVSGHGGIAGNEAPDAYVKDAAEQRIPGKGSRKPGGQRGYGRGGHGRGGHVLKMEEGGSVHKARTRPRNTVTKELIGNEAYPEEPPQPKAGAQDRDKKQTIVSFPSPPFSSFRLFLSVGLYCFSDWGVLP